MIRFFWPSKSRPWSTWILTGVVLLAPVSLLAQSRNQFFDNNVVNDFSVPVTERRGAGFDFFIDTAAKKAEAAKLEPTPAMAPPAIGTVSTPQNFESGEDVRAAFGDPLKDAPVLAQDNAPKPFKAMMAAFQAGDDQLAYQYARQWVRYMGNLKARTMRVVDAARAAEMSEGISVAGGNGEQLKQAFMNDNANLAANLDPRAAAILKQAEADEAAPQKPKNDLEQQELKARQEVRRQLTGKIPVDPKGRADVYLFFGVNDENPAAFVETAKAIQAYTMRYPKVNFVAFVNARLNQEGIERLTRKLGLPFQILVGDGFARELQLSTTPAVVIVSPTQGAVVKERGDKPLFYYEELISMVQGG
jgi:hypothetical protein